jgi:hypothetical protein
MGFSQVASSGTLSAEQRRLLGRIRDRYVDANAALTGAFLFVPQLIESDVVSEVEAMALLPA